MQDAYKGEMTRDVPPARPGAFAPLAIGPREVGPPGVRAPMAGVTNWPFRTRCARVGAGLYVSEMITARPLVEGREKALKLADFAPEESPRSLQLYGVDPHFVGEAVKRLVGEGRVDHIDMNFGCPVRKVTRKGGGAAIPVRPLLLRDIVRAAVRNAGDVPVTIKFRMGIDEALLTYEDAGRIGEEEGCAAVALHARTAAQLYDGEARWEHIARLKQAVTRIAVLGNGDVWEAWDALRMMRATGCAGVIVGRGCLGRPWLFGELAEVFDGREPTPPPTFGGIVGGAGGGGLGIVGPVAGALVGGIAVAPACVGWRGMVYVATRSGFRQTVEKRRVALRAVFSDVSQRAADELAHQRAQQRVAVRVDTGADAAAELEVEAVRDERRVAAADD